MFTDGLQKLSTSDHRIKTHNSEHKCILFIGDWLKGMDLPYKENELMIRMGAAHQLWSFIKKLFPSYTKGKYGLVERLERKSYDEGKNKGNQGTVIILQTPLHKTEST